MKRIQQNSNTFADAMAAVPDMASWTMSTRRKGNRPHFPNAEGNLLTAFSMRLVLFKEDKV
jgi:hypothetical protein